MSVVVEVLSKTLVFRPLLQFGGDAPCGSHRFKNAASMHCWCCRNFKNAAVVPVSMVSAVAASTLSTWLSLLQDFFCGHLHLHCDRCPAFRRSPLYCLKNDAAATNLYIVTARCHLFMNVSFVTSTVACLETVTAATA